MPAEFDVAWKKLATCRLKVQIRGFAIYEGDREYDG